MKCLTCFRLRHTSRFNEEIYRGIESNSGLSSREVEMAHKVLSKDMFELVATMRLALQYSETTLDSEYRK